MGMTLQVEPIETTAALQSLASDWRALFIASGSRLPFFTYEWADCWWKYMRQSRAGIRDELYIRAIRAEDGRLVAIAPLIRTQRLAFGPIGIRYIHFLGADPNMTEIRGMLVLPG